MEQRPIATATAISPPDSGAARARKIRLARTAGALVTSLFAAALLARKFSQLRFEDALITLRYGRNIAEGHGWVFNHGEQVLGVSSPLQTLIAALACVVSQEHAMTIINSLGAFFLVASAVMAGLVVSRGFGAGPGTITALLCGSNFGLNHLYLGMELPLFVLLVLSSVFCLGDLARGRGIRLGLLLGLVFLTRHDAALLIAFVALTNVTRHPSATGKMLASSALLVLPWLLFAWLYFGSVLATPMAAKEGHTMMLDYLLSVGSYIFEMLKSPSGQAFFVPHLAYGFAAGATVLMGWGVVLLLRRAATALLTLFGIAQLLVYAWIGADPAFTWHYYLLHTIVWSALAVGFGSLVQLGSQRQLMRNIALAVPILLLGTAFLKAMNRPYLPATLNRDMHHIGNWIDRRYADETRLLTPSIGIFGWVTNLTIIDHAGLITPGLYYWDDTRKTPVADVVRAHQPDLILVLDANPRYVYTPGFRLRKTFRTPSPFVLYERLKFDEALRLQPSGS